jgi:hypothetical protein
MKKIIVLLPILLFAFGCNNGQSGLEEIVYPPANNAPAANDQTTTVKVAVIALDDGGKTGPKIGCNDSVVYITKTIPQTTQPLNEAMKQLFALNSEIVRGQDSDQEFYNVISKMESLKFDHATLENGIGKIYLTGSFAGLGGVCDSPRVQAQIEETANQFKLILETYLNGKKVDWQKFSSQK